jgi:hypothetical protein
MASRHQFVIGRDVVCRAVAQHHADGHAYRVAAEMDLGGEAAAQRPSAWNWAHFSGGTAMRPACGAGDHLQRVEFAAAAPTPDAAPLTMATLPASVMVSSS